MVSAGTLAVFAVVALALIWHRYVDPKVGGRGFGADGAGGNLGFGQGLGRLRLGKSEGGRPG
jgi:hypothetical protein